MYWPMTTGDELILIVILVLGLCGLALGWWVWGGEDDPK